MDVPKGLEVITDEYDPDVQNSWTIGNNRSHIKANFDLMAVEMDTGHH